MVEERIREYAQIIVERLAEVEEGENVYLVSKSLDSLPLFREVRRQVIEKGACPFENFLFDSQSGERMDYDWMKKASEKQIQHRSEVKKQQMEEMDAFIKIKGRENMNELSTVDPERISTWRETTRPIKEERLEKNWVLAVWPTEGLAQHAGIPTEKLREMIIGGIVETDWEKLAEKNLEIKKVFDDAEEVRITDGNTDLSLSLEGRKAATSEGDHNLPDGEIFYAPVKDSLNGKISFEHPVTAGGNEVSGIELEFKEGEVVNFSAEKNEEYLENMIETDEGSRYVGEFGIGTNRNIDRYIKFTTSDEKIGGTVHLALGNSHDRSVPEGVEGNSSSIHWDLVKDLREKSEGGKIFVDGELVQENGEWVF